MLYSSYLVTGCAIIFSKLRFDDDLRVELIRDDKIRRLIETGLAVSRRSQPVVFQMISDDHVAVWLGSMAQMLYKMACGQIR